MTKNKKIVMVLSNPFKPDPRVYKEAKSLVKNGYDVTVVAWDREGRYPKYEVVDGIKIQRISLKAKYGNPFTLLIKLPLFYILAILKIMKMEFDIIHTHDFDTAIVGFLFKKIKNKKWIFDIHDIYFDRLQMEGSERSLKNTFVSFLSNIEILFSKLSDFVIVATGSIGGKYEGLREYYIRGGVPPERIIVIWNSPDFSVFNKERYLSIRNTKKKIPFVVSYLGNIRTLSGFIPLLEAISLLDGGYKLLLVGAGPALEELKKIISNEYPTLDVEFITPVPYDKVIEYYAISDAVYAYYPFRENIKRGLATKLLEASGLGIPVIVSRGTLMEDFVREYKCGITFDEISISELKEGILTLKTIRFNPQFVQKKWNWEKEERKLLKLYGVILK
ncbi:glycosyltransferase family 4 protein [Thermococcus sp. PK]|uniref:glycosyltransferase family 4 protein n=1 Tax=Thermococcus sp. PK TaxID=913025 RepID=UPI0005B2EA95|nr:glycosyltransferase family 4 protein [Thermococcus sp. PK]